MGRTGGMGRTGRIGRTFRPFQPFLPILPFVPSRLLDEEHLPVGRQRPRLVRDDDFEGVARFA